MDIVYLNGEFLPRSQAKVSVFDRGFLFGDGVYEVIPVFKGLLFQEDEHFARLALSLKAIHLDFSFELAELKKIFYELLVKNNQQKATLNIYLQVTRGEGKTRIQAFPEVVHPTVLIACVPAVEHSREELARGYKAITLEDSRRRDCYIKAITLLPSILLYEEARKKGAVDAILIRENEVTEGTMSNVFIVKNGLLMTPSKNHKLLGGVTRELIIKLARENNIPCQETSISPEMLEQADEIWLTGSSKEICPIVKLNEKIISNGKAGPLWQRMFDLYESCKLRKAKSLQS